MDGLVSRLELAAELKVTPRSLDRWADLGLLGVKLERTYIGDRVWFRRADVRAWQAAVNRRRSESRKPPPPKAAARRKAALAALAGHGIEG